MIVMVICCIQHLMMSPMKELAYLHDRMRMERDEPNVIQCVQLVIHCKTSIKCRVPNKRWVSNKCQGLLAVQSCQTTSHTLVTSYPNT